MFLVEITKGRRSHYSNARALGAAIRCGELGPQARIFHQTSGQWLPITVHPEYRRAESEWEQKIARRWRANGWTFFSDRGNGTGEDRGAGDESHVGAHRLGLGAAMRRLLHRDQQEA